MSPAGVAAEMALDEKHTRDDAIALAAGRLVECKRMHTLLTPEACQKYRRGDSLYGGSNMACEKCPQAIEMDRLAADRRGDYPPIPRVAVPVGGKDDEESDVAEKVCLDCGDEKKILGRGLCGTCYHRNKRNGTLDEKFPRVDAKPAADVTEPDDDGQVTEAEPELQEHGGGQAQEAAPIAAPSELILRILDRDRDLFAFLQAWADFDRRSLEDQVLFVLDNVVADKRQEAVFDSPCESGTVPARVV